VEPGSYEELPIFEASEAVNGKVTISVPAGKRFEHLGAKVDLYGVVETYVDRTVDEFCTGVCELSGAGELSGDTDFEFKFDGIGKHFETYFGVNARVRYYVRVTVARSYNSNVVEERGFCVEALQVVDDEVGGIKLEVGIEECLHIEFEYNKSKYHLEDVVLGKIYFLLVRIKIKHMEVAIIRRETAGPPGSEVRETDTIAKYEVMDGAPAKGECVPLRMYLSGFDLTPTYRNVRNKFSVKYFLNLVLVDEEDRRYFKQSEVTFWRKALK
jgi:vacuolar protein sorting-associated protein 26